MKTTDPSVLSENYMKVYNEITEKYQTSGIQELVDNLNDAIVRKNMKQVNEDYTKVLDWNYAVANLEGTRNSLNGQFSYLHLPSAMMFTIVFDESEKKWKFNSGS